MGYDLLDTQQKLERYQIQQAMTLLCEAMKACHASGSVKGNYIERLDVIDRKDCIDMFGNKLCDGTYVRPIWSDGMHSNDGYYDININGDSGWGAIIDVVDNLRHIF